MAVQCGGVRGGVRGGIERHEARRAAAGTGLRDGNGASRCERGSRSARTVGPQTSTESALILAPLAIKCRLRQLAVVRRQVVQLAQPLQVPFPAVLAHGVR